MRWGKGDVREIKKGGPNLNLHLCESSLLQILALTANSLASRLSISSCPRSVYNPYLLPDGTVQVLLEGRRFPAAVFRSLPSSVWRCFVGRHFFQFLLVHMLVYVPGARKAAIVSVLEMPFEQPYAVHINGFLQKYHFDQLTRTDFEYVGLSGRPDVQVFMKT